MSMDYFWHCVALNALLVASRCAWSGGGTRTIRAARERLFCSSTSGECTSRSGIFGRTGMSNAVLRQIWATPRPLTKAQRRKRRRKSFVFCEIYSQEESSYFYATAGGFPDFIADESRILASSAFSSRKMGFSCRSGQNLFLSVYLFGGRQRDVLYL